MTTPDWELVGRLFDEARVLAPDRWDSFLEARAPDEATRMEVRSLLSHVTDDSFLERPALGAPLSTTPLRAASSGPPLAPGTRIGGCTIRRLLGRGGMGDVYEAEQDEPRRSVAIKTLSADAGVPGPPARFRREAAALARLRHPGIAAIFGAGVENVDGAPVPFLIMELVEGARDILTYCREERPARRPLLELFASACDAVAHGHMRGVIHRDLKPTNILVDRAGAARIIDFGVAALLEAPGVSRAPGGTLPGDLIGTPRYMSPEQAGGDSDGPDVRGDVYSLGVVLYELLTGRVPHDTPHDAHPLAVVRAIRERDPVPLSAVDPSLRGDSEAVVMKALARLPADRYASPADFAADVRRLANRWPVLARRRPWWHAVAMNARRHPALWTAGAVAVAVVTAALAVAASGLARAAREGRTSAAVTEFLSGMLASPRVRREGHAVRVLDVLDDAEEPLARIEDPDVRIALRRALAETYEAAGEYDKSRVHFEQLVAESTARRGPDHPQTVWAATKLAGALYDNARFSESEALYRRLLERSERSRDHEATARLRNDLALVYIDTQRLDDAERLLAQIVDFRRGSGPQRELAQALYNLGVVHYNSGRHESADAFLREGTDRLAAVEGVDGRDAAAMRRFLAQNLLRLGRLDESESNARAAHQSLLKAVGPDHPDTAAAAVTLARVARARQDTPGADTHYTEALRAYRASLGAAHQYTVKIETEYAAWKNGDAP